MERFCKCGCGEKIIEKKHHAYYGTPDYVIGHSSRGRKLNNQERKQQLKEFEKLKKRKNFCQCGCGTEIVIKPHHKRCGIPKYLRGHCNKGRKQSKNHILNRFASLKGYVHSKEIRDKISLTLEGRKLSNEVKEKISMAMTGERVFIGFKTKFHERLRNSKEYNQWRISIFKRDNFICQNPNCIYCNNIKEFCAGLLNAHHKIALSVLLKEHKVNNMEKALACEQLWDINNGITYCKDFHSTAHA